MRVTSVESVTLRARLPEPIFDARSEIAARAAVLVRVRTEERAITGWGEAACFGGVGHPVAAMVEHLAPLVVGRAVEPRAIGRDLTSRCAHHRGGITLAAISGIEIALWDALGKHAGLPVSSLLGHYPAAIPVYQTLGFYRGRDAADDLDWLRRDLGAVDPGRIARVKIKIGRWGAADDVRRVTLARDVLGSTAVLIADANNAYDVRGAAALSRSLDDLGVHFIEEPIEFGDPARSARLRDASRVPIAGYELDADYRGCLSYINAQSVDYIQPDAIWSGGIAECAEIAQAARRHGIAMVPHNFSTPVSTAANYHLATVSGSPMLEIDGTRSSRLTDITILDDGWSVTDGSLRMTEGSGLGLPDLGEWLEEIHRADA